MSQPNITNTTNLVPVQAIFDSNGAVISLVGPSGAYFSPPINMESITNSNIDSSPIGVNSPAVGVFTSLTALNGISGGTI